MIELIILILLLSGDYSTENNQVVIPNTIEVPKNAVNTTTVTVLGEVFTALGTNTSTSTATQTPIAIVVTTTGTETETTTVTATSTSTSTGTSTMTSSTGT